jgi:hypothetical protein
MLDSQEIHCVLGLPTLFAQASRLKEYRTKGIYLDMYKIILGLSHTGLSIKENWCLTPALV